MTWQFTLTGLLIGVLVGLTGMGGGSLMTPILILLFGFNAKVAVGTDILIEGGSVNNLIGGTTPAARNVIANQPSNNQPTYTPPNTNNSNPPTFFTVNVRVRADNGVHLEVALVR